MVQSIDRAAQVPMDRESTAPPLPCPTPLCTPGTAAFLWKAMASFVVLRQLPQLMDSSFRNRGTTHRKHDRLRCRSEAVFWYLYSGFQQGTCVHEL